MAHLSSGANPLQSHKLTLLPLSCLASTLYPFYTLLLRSVPPEHPYHSSFACFIVNLLSATFLTHPAFPHLTRASVSSLDLFPAYSPNPIDQSLSALFLTDPDTPLRPHLKNPAINICKGKSKVTLQSSVRQSDEQQKQQHQNTVHSPLRPDTRCDAAEKPWKQPRRQ